MAYSISDYNNQMDRSMHEMQEHMKREMYHQMRGCNGPIDRYFEQEKQAAKPEPAQPDKRLLLIEDDQ